MSRLTYFKKIKMIKRNMDFTMSSLNISSTNCEEYMPGSKSAYYHNFKVTWQGQIRSNRKIPSWLLAPLYTDMFCKISARCD